MALFVSVAVATGTAAAQDATTIDYVGWEDAAKGAEEIIAAKRASNEALEALRARIVAWRSTFAQGQDANSAKIATVRSQIDALPPAPAEGATEAEEIAARRAALAKELAQLQAPAIAAVEANKRADGLIRQIDALIRERQADALLRLSPSPLNPTNWAAGWAVLTQGVATMMAEAREAWDNPTRQAELKGALPVVLLLLALAGAFIVYGPRVMEALTRRLQRRATMRSRHVLAALVSLGQIAVPVLGTLSLSTAILLTGMTGIRTGELVAALPLVALAFFVTRWLASWIFPAEGPGDVVRFEFTDRPAEARLIVTLIGLVAAAEVFRLAFVTEVRPPLSMAAKAMWEAPLVVVLSVLLLRLGLLLRRRPVADTPVTLMRGEDDGATPDGGRGFWTAFLRLLANATVAVAVLAPVLAMIGYVAAAEALAWPLARSLMLFGFLYLLQRFATDVYLAASGRGEEARDALVPVLIGFGLFVLSVPLFALVWGARIADLQELWTQFNEGFSFGSTKISPANFLVFVAVFVVGYLITRTLQAALRGSVLPRTAMDQGAQNAILAGIGYSGIFLAADMAITAAGIDLSGLAIVAGALSVGIGFGLQNIVSNFVSGIILLIERPISEGDWIEVGGIHGTVKGISVRSTRIQTFDRADVIVPNADLVSGMVTNWTRFNLTGRLIVPVGVAYGTDTKTVEAILSEIARAQPLVAIEPEPQVYFVGFGADSLNFEIRVILRDVNLKLPVQSAINHEIAARFAAEGIEIPFAQRDIWLRNPEALQAAKPAPAARRRKPEAGKESA
ncbi:MAG: DUF3772 domain-containing protein [Paracoccaceae bacterium]